MGGGGEVPDRLTESKESPLLKKEREKTWEQVGGSHGQLGSHLLGRDFESLKTR